MQGNAIYIIGTTMLSASFNENNETQTLSFSISIFLSL